MMTTGPLPSLTPAVPAPGSTARKLVRPDDQDGTGSSFNDFLPDGNGTGSSTKTKDDETAADAIAKLKADRVAADQADAAKEAANPNARPPGPPMMPPIMASSAQQAALTAQPDAPTADEAADRAKAAASQAGTATDAVPARDLRSKMPLIRPHGPPPTGGTTMPPDTRTAATDPTTGGVKAIHSPIEPHGPPQNQPIDQPVTLWNDSRQMTTVTALPPAPADTTKTAPPLVAPHGPLRMPPETAAAPPTATAGPAKQAFISPIEPHGPPDQPDDTAAVAALPTADPIKQAVPPSIAPHSPPDQPDVRAKAAAAGSSEVIQPDMKAKAAANIPVNPVKQPPIPTIEPHGPPDQPDVKVKAATVPVNPVKQPPIPSIEPHGPPDQPDVTIKTATTPAADQSKKAAISLIEPHGPPINVDAPVALSATAAPDQRKAADFPLIEPHGPPTMPNDELLVAPPAAPALPGGMGKLEYTTTLPAPTGNPANPVPTTAGSPTGMAKGEYTTTIPQPADERQRTATAGVSADVVPRDNGASFWNGGVSAEKSADALAPSVEITSAMQAWVPLAATAPGRIVPLNADARSASDEEGAATAESAPAPAIRPAILAAQPFAESPRAVGSINRFNSQVTLPQQITNSETSGGTPIAKEQAIVTAEAATTETTIDRSSLLRRGGAGSPVSGVTARATTSIDAQKAFAIAPAPSVDSAATLRADASPVAAANPTQNAEHVQKMLQTVLDAGIKTGVNGTNHLEMRVRLDGGANDVTVRLQMQDSRMNVTFQTGSPELRQALERGWSDFTTHAAQTAAVTVEPPRFVADTAARTQNATDFSGGQQNPSRQDTRRTADDARPVAGSVWRGSQVVSATATQPTPTARAATDRWTGWA